MTPTVTKGKHGQFLWLERSIEPRAVDRPVIGLTKHCPDVLLNKRLLVPSLDSGPMRLTDNQLNAGWKRLHKLAISPQISNVGEVPFCWFDEWYVFDNAVPTIVDIEVFVNKGTFSLGEPNPTIDTMYIGSDASTPEQLIAAVVPYRETFWAQLEWLNPESYVANGNCFTFVTRNAGHYSDVSALMHSL